ncbi:hypothetical protein GCM10009863_35240 [Streptomyces axinellae]|uniref:Uncharacterized protein n=1 Tax=Streptomyces axinellae TaxID=552788 RepID=A0ABP6CFW8_9ACTN
MLTVRDLAQPQLAGEGVQEIDGRQVKHEGSLQGCVRADVSHAARKNGGEGWAQARITPGQGL